MNKLSTGEVIVVIALLMGIGAWSSNAPDLALAGFFVSVIGVALIVQGHGR